MFSSWLTILLCFVYSLQVIKALPEDSCHGFSHVHGKDEHQNQRSRVKAPATVRHDASFVPDAILRVTHENSVISCYPEKMTFLVNGTAPGPELRIPAGKTTWIRVYNDMHDHNLTMVDTNVR